MFWHLDACSRGKRSMCSDDAAVVVTGGQDTEVV